MSSRIECDLLGSIEVPAGAAHGVQTQRAIDNFPVGRQRTIGSFPTLVCALLQIKKAAALANLEIGALPEEKGFAICQAADDLLRRDCGRFFPVHHLHGGGGTSANMNANEVLANLSEAMLGGHYGEYALIHPNDHVNLNQSTNDVYPTACHMAVIAEWQNCSPILDTMVLELAKLADRYRGLRRLARTCWQDAVDITYGDYFGGMVSQLRRLSARVDDAVDRLHAVNLGATICGRAEDAPLAYRERIISHLCRVTGDHRFLSAVDLYDAAQNPDGLVLVSAELDLLARSLIKIAKDLRVLGSGPEGGLGELHLPPVQPGSSIMPGKVNPVMPEFLIQACFRVIGNHSMCAAGLDHGELDLNVWESSMTCAILESMELIEAGIGAFTEKCLQGIKPDPAANEAHASSLVPRLTLLARRHGHRRVTLVCRQAGGDLEALRRRLDTEFGVSGGEGPSTAGASQGNFQDDVSR